MAGPLIKFLNNNPSILIFFTILSLITVIITIGSEAFGYGFISTSLIKVIGKTLCICLVAIAMDLVWGYCGILSLGHFAFFGLGGYMIGMWLMYERTRLIVIESAKNAQLPMTTQEIQNAIGSQIFGVVGGSEFPIVWTFSHLLYVQLLLVILVPGLLGFIFGWLAFRSRVTGVYLSILTQAMTLALALYLFQNDSGLRGNNGLSGLQNIPGLELTPQSVISVWFLWGSASALAFGFLVTKFIVESKLGNVIRGIKDNEQRMRFLGYNVENYKLFIFTITAIISAISGALYYPQAGIINPAELAPIASIYLAVWVAIGGRGRIYGAVIGAALVSLLSSWLTGGQAPDISFGIIEFKWVDWWLVFLGISFVIITLYAPKGIGGLFDRFNKGASK